MNIGYVTDCGNVRMENQDRYLVVKDDSIGAFLCVVADGMGGTQEGSLASDYIVNTLHTWWQMQMPELLRQDRVHLYISQSMDLLLEACNEEINRQAVIHQITTGTTVSLMFGYKNQAVIKHAGDSRIYLQRNGVWSQLTIDHTWEQQELLLGKNPKEDPHYEQKKNALTNALGAGEVCEISTIVLQMIPQDRYLICTDGFYKYIELGTYLPQRNIRIPLQQFMEQLAVKVKMSAALDNFTAILIDCTSQNENGQKEDVWTEQTLQFY